MAQARRLGECWVAFLTVLLACSGALAQDKICSPAIPGGLAPPDYFTVFENEYTLILEMTKVKSNITYYVEEVRERRNYHGLTSDTAAVYIRVNGSEIIYHFYPETDTFVEQYDNQCRDSGLDRPSFDPWGWFDTEHGKSYGPATLLRLTHFFEMEFVAETNIDGVNVERYRACEADGHVEIFYSYSEVPWQMPEITWFPGEDDRIPVEFEVEMQDMSELYQYHVLKFVPWVEHHHLLEVPRGLSCEGLVGVVSDLPVPDIPSHFSLAEEVVSNPMIDGVSLGSQHLDKVKFAYAEDLSLVRLDVVPPNYITALTDHVVEIVHDFNTGAQYIIDREFGNCSIDRIPDFTFDTHFGGMLGTGGSMLGPNELFHLDDTYAYVGERSTREVGSDMWTSTRDDIPDPEVGWEENYPKAVLEYYFSQGVEVTPTNKVPVKMPIRGDLFTYNRSNPLQVTGMMTTNFYDFKEVALYTETEFSVEECYERWSDRWSYLIITFPAAHKNQFQAAEKKPDLFKHKVLELIISRGDISPVRIASIDVSEGVSGLIPNTTDADLIIVSVKLLERAPYLLSFRTPSDEPNKFPGVNEKSFEGVHTEDCARFCLEERGFQCKSFHHCDDRICFLSSLDTADGEPVDTVNKCYHWVSSVDNQTFVDLPSSEVYSVILDAIRHGKFMFSIPYKNDTVLYEASMSFHYRTPDPLDPIRMQFTLEARSMTIVKVDYIQEDMAILDECLALCVGWKAFRCETVVHKPIDKQCMLLAAHYHDINSTYIKPESDSWIHSRSYLADYSPVFGGVALNTSGPTYENVDHLEACARYCSQETSISCQSFEWCHELRLCHLHQEHFLDVVDGGNYEVHTSCTHFSKRNDQLFSRYPHQGLPSDSNRLVAFKTDVSSCAKLCIEESDMTCQSFDFCTECGDDEYSVCGEDNSGSTNLCFLSSHHLGEDGVALTAATSCEHYSRDVFGDVDYPTWVSRQRKSDKPYTSGDMTGLAFGMIFLGILVAVAFLFGMTYAKPTSVPKDFSISFVNLKSGESSS